MADARTNGRSNGSSPQDQNTDKETSCIPSHSFSCVYDGISGKVSVTKDSVKFEGFNLFALETRRDEFKYGEFVRVTKKGNDGVVIVTNVGMTNDEVGSQFKEKDNLFTWIKDQDQAFLVIITFWEIQIGKDQLEHLQSETPPPAMTKTNNAGGKKTNGLATSKSADIKVGSILSVVAKTKIRREFVIDKQAIQDIEDSNSTATTKLKTPKEIWEGLKTSKNPSFREVGLEVMVIPCDLDTFYSTFLANSAPHPISKFQESIGDTNISLSPWKMEGDSQTRTMSYDHPVNNPLAPPKARATKEQCLQRFADVGICIDTHTVVNDVPMTDCFFTDDRMLIEKCPAGRGVLLSARFEIRFVKNTMFRAVIEATTRGDFQKWFRSFGNMIQLAVEGTAPGVQLLPPSVKAAEAVLPQQVPPQGVLLKTIIVLLSLLLIGQWVLILQLRQIVLAPAPVMYCPGT